jgi:cytochrome c-type biogenesis protein
MNIDPGLAFLAGLASFLSPCVFSLIPGFISYLGGRSIAGSTAMTGVNPVRGRSFTHGLLFFIGFGLVFIFPRVMVSELGGVLYTLRDWLSKIGGMIIIIFGLQLTGVLRLPILNKNIKPSSGLDRWQGYLLSGLVGAFFSAGWSPCVGPTLGGILTLGMAGSATGKSVELLSFYSAGLAIPFLLLAGGMGWLAGQISRFKQVMHITEIVAGILLIFIGGMLSMGTFEQISRFGYFVDFGL